MAERITVTENVANSLDLAEFSLFPTTQTTTVVTTTTVSTKFPPLILKKPQKKLEDWDATTYPLKDASTPIPLRRFVFELDGKAATFTEADRTEYALVEVMSPNALRIISDECSSRK